MVECLRREITLKDVLTSRLDFTSAGELTIDEHVPKNCQVLQPDKTHYSDKSTTGSPVSSHRGERQPSCSASSSCSSPMSYTQDLIGSDSPGLSGISSLPKSPLPSKSPLTDDSSRSSKVVSSSSTLPSSAVEGHPPKIRRSRFDIPPCEADDREARPSSRSAEDVDGSSTLNVIRFSNGMGKKRPYEEAAEENGKADQRVKEETAPLESKKPRIKEETAPPETKKPTLNGDKREKEIHERHLASGIGSILQRLKMEGNKPVATVMPSVANPSTPTPAAVKKNVIGIATPPPVSPLIGPQLPPQFKKESTNKLVQNDVVVGKKTPERKSAEMEPKRSTAPGSARKRLLSERGEKELSFPLIDTSIISQWTWGNSPILANNRMRGSGLVNRSNDCFLNVVLQLITHTAPISRYLLERHKHDCRREQSMCVACGMAGHIGRAFRSPLQNALDTGWIRSHLKRIFPSHMNGMQEDAHELLTLLLDAIDPPIGSSNGSALPPGIQSNKLKPSTPVEQIFGGTLRNEVMCLACNTPHINYERIRELNLAITRKSDSERVSIASLITDYFNNETLQAFSCKKCGRKTQAQRTTRLLRSPALLIIQLKRFNAYGGKIRTPVVPDRELELKKWMFCGGLSPEGVNGMTKSATSSYILTGIADHLGATVDHGHYVAFARGTDFTSWYRFDDEVVQKLNIVKVQESSNPYLLVYTRSDLAPSSVKAVNGEMTSAGTPMKSPCGSAYGNGSSNSHGGMMGQPPTSHPYSNGNSKLVHSNGNGNGYSNGYSQQSSSSGFKRFSAPAAMNRPNGAFGNNGSNNKFQPYQRVQGYRNNQYF